MKTPSTTTQPTPMTVRHPNAPQADSRKTAAPPEEPQPHEEPGYGHGV